MDNVLSVQSGNFYFEIEQINNASYFSEQNRFCYILSGSAYLFIEHRHFLLQPDDFFVADAFETHELQGVGGEPVSLLTMSVSQAFLRTSGDLSTSISCCSANAEHPRESYDSVRQLFIDLFSLYYKGEENVRMQMYSILYSLFHSLRQRFGVAVKKAVRSNDSAARLQRVLKYIDENYNKDISLAQIAKMEYLSQGHFSRLFHQYVGLPLTKYLQNKRLVRASGDLYSTDLSITDIALKNGFSNTTTFIECFKSRYGQTPGAARSQWLRDPAIAVRGSLPHDLIERLLMRASRAPENPAYAVMSKRREQLRVNCAKPGKRIKVPFVNQITVTHIKDILFKPVQDQLLQLKQKIPFEFLLVHGVFDDSMMVYSEQGGVARYNFTYVDIALDFIASLGLLPHIVLDHIPFHLTSNKHMLYEKLYISMPSSMSKWNNLVRAFIVHCIDRYGLGAVQRWRFSAMFSSLIYLNFLTYEEYLELFENTYRTVKAQHESLTIGALGHHIEIAMRDGYESLKRFLLDCGKRRCTPDFVLFQGYHSSTTMEELSLNGKGRPGQDPPCEGEPPDDFSGHYKALCKTLSGLGFPEGSVIFEIWHALKWYQDMCNDTGYKAAYLFKTLLQCWDAQFGVGLFSLTDFMQELGIGKEIFHGGCGLFTINGIPKSAFHALNLLGKLGTRRIASGDSYFVAASPDGSQYTVALYHYCGFDTEELADKAPSDVLDRYSVFSDDGNLVIDLLLENLPHGKYEMERYVLNRRHGSAYDAWLMMGSPLQMRDEQIGALSRASQPEYTTQVGTSPGFINVFANMEPHEVQVIILKFWA